MTIRPATADEHATIHALLVDAALPVADLRESSIDFVVAHEHGRLLGAVGLETFGDVGLLRSLVVRADRRGAGTGDRLVHALEDAARVRGMQQLVLLTTTAARFFANRGYAVIDRAAAPAAVQGSAEFRALCPASATCMSKLLEARA